MNDLLRQVLGIFVTETREQAQRIADALLAMERNPETIPTAIEELYRDAHSLKGSSSSLGLDELEALAHELETALLGVRRQQVPLSAALVDAGLRAMDAVQERTAGLEADNEVGLAAVLARTAELRALETAQATQETDPREATQREVPISPATSPTEQSPALLGNDPSSVRMPVERLLMLAQRTDDLRRLHGRMDRHARTLLHANQLLDKLSRTLPVSTTAGGKRSGEPLVLREVLRTLRALRRELLEDTEQLGAASGEYAETLRALRLLPATLLKQPLLRTVREACRVANKDAELSVIGDEIWLDRTLLEEIKNPLLHLLRNAVDHGIEPTETRRAQGKLGRGQIRVTMAQEGGEIVITVRDDGRGIDSQAVKKQALARGLVTADAVETLSESAIYRLLLLPGFSTAHQVTALSGRGVGLDVVHSTVERLGGRLEISAQPGNGACFSMSLPMTLVAAQVLLLEEPDGVYALPQASVDRIQLVRREALAPMGTRMGYRQEGDPLVVARLMTLLQPSSRPDWPAQLPLLQMSGSDPRIALTCQRLQGEAELILQPLPIELRRHRLLSALAQLPTGEVLLVLKPSGLLAAALAPPPEAQPRSQPTILVADDSLTTRSLLRGLLEGSGYKVRTAADGEEALDLLHRDQVDLLVSDVHMPRIGGLALVERLRSDARFARLPVVLFSSADRDEDKQQGVASGANAYLTKAAFDRGQLIDEIHKLLPRVR